jgi:hypothetical protein
MVISLALPPAAALLMLTERGQADFVRPLAILRSVRHRRVVGRLLYGISLRLDPGQGYRSLFCIDPEHLNLTFSL